MSLGEFSVRNSVLVNIVIVLVLVLGAFSVLRLPQEQFAEVPFYFINISVPYPGVSAEDVEESVTRVVENEMQGVDRLDTYTSLTQDGLASITLEFEEDISGREFDRVFQDVRNRFQRLALPDGVGQERIEEFSSNDFLPVIEVVLHGGGVDYDTLNRTAEHLVDRCGTIPDVSGVELIGSRERTVFVEADPGLMESYGVTIGELVQAIRDRNTTVPGGSLTTPTRRFLLRTIGDVEEARRLEEVVVRAAGGTGGAGSAEGSTGRPGLLYLSDLARVVEGYDADGVAARFNGEQAISIRVAKVPGGSSVDIVEEVRERVAQYDERVIPDGISVSFINDSTVQIRDSIDVLVNNAIIGLVLLVAILLVFVGVRNALMTGLGIPVTFAITFVVLELMGETFNSNTLFALVLVLGLIVDHAIVIVENSFRLQTEGRTRRQAAVDGVNQVAVPVWAATLTTVAAFLPLAFLPGIIGRFLRVVPITVAIALFASTFEATVFLPSHFADWPGGAKAVAARLERTRARFRRLLAGVYRRRGFAAAGIVLVMAGAFAGVGTIRQDFFAADEASLFYVDIEMPPGTSTARTDEAVTRFEERMLPLVEEREEYQAINSYIGFAAGEQANTTDPRVGQLVVDLAELGRGRDRSVAEVIAEARELTAGIPGPEDVRFRTQATGPPVDAPVVFRLFGDSYEELGTASERIRRQLAEYDGVFDIRDNLEVQSPELQIITDDAEAARFGLSRREIGEFVQGAFDGLAAGSIFADNEETPVRVRYDVGNPVRAERLLQLLIPTPGGRRIPLSAVAEVEDSEAFASIRRLNGRREVTVEADALEDVDLGAIDRDVAELFREEIALVAPGVELETEGQFAEFQELLLDVLRVLLIGVFLIYAILATQFKSYTQPLLILFSVPFAFVGVVLYLVLTGIALSSTVIYAAVALAGIAVNDSIVLISFINEKRREGASTREAVLEGAATRMRPILLTTMTTIAGLLPTALGIGGWSVVWGPMAGTIVVGLVFSTLTSLLVIPCIYGLFYERTRYHEEGEPA